MINKVLGNRYKIVEKIGEGGMGYVYKARCNLLNRTVAIKILQPQYGNDKEFIKSFKREAQATASLCHSNIVNIYDVGKEDEIEYIVMEYVEGSTLKDIIKNEGPLEDEKIINIGLQISEALEHAHKNHIIHRDIKPQNIIVTEENKVKVADFGIAKGCPSNTITQSNKIMGSVYYFSPEQAKGVYVGEKADLYSLGVVLYEMATGRVPFDGESPISVALKHINEMPIPPKNINRNLTKSLDSIILKALSKDQNDRYQKASEFYFDFKKALASPNKTLFSGKPDINKTIQVEPITVIDSDESNKGRDEMLNKQKSQNNKMNKKTKVLLISIIIITLLAAGFTWAVSYIRSYLLVPIVEVPQAVGLYEDEAIRLFEEIGLDYEITDRVFSDMPTGTVVEQRPIGGDEVRVSRPPVNLWVSKGDKQISVPNLIGRGEREARIILSTFELELGNIEKEHNDEFDLGAIIEQNPKFNEQVEERTVIDVVVSKGAEPVEITLPDFRGQEYNNVLEQLNELRIETGNIIFQDNREYPENTIISQSPQPNEMLLQGKSINLIVSKGYEQGEVRIINIPKIKLPSRPNELNVEIVITDEEGKRTVYSETHSPEDSPLSVTFQGVGSVKVDIIVNGVVWAEQVY